MRPTACAGALLAAVVTLLLPEPAAPQLGQEPSRSPRTGHLVVRPVTAREAPRPTARAVTVSSVCDAGG